MRNSRFAAVLRNGSLVDNGQINVSGFGNALDNESVIVNDVLTILPNSALTIDQGSTVPTPASSASTIAALASAN
jgi:hypothetical protein